MEAPTSKSPRKAVILLSGGLDSATCLAIAREQGFSLHAISFHYGQRHQTELQCARRLAEAFRVAAHVVVDINLAQFGGSALTTNLGVPKHRSDEAMGTGIPITYVPARNTVFLALALAWAETLGARDLMIGVNALDYSGYPDCRPEFIEQFQRLAQLATKVGVEERDPWRIHAPLVDLSKQQIIAEGLRLGVDYAMTFSCYDPVQDGIACGACDACQLRQRGFAQNQINDPARHA